MTDSSEAFRIIRERMDCEDVPLNVAADIEQIICEVAGDWGASGSGSVTCAKGNDS